MTTRSTASTLRSEVAVAERILALDARDRSQLESLHGSLGALVDPVVERFYESLLCSVGEQQQPFSRLASYSEARRAHEQLFRTFLSNDGDDSSQRCALETLERLGLTFPLLLASHSQLLSVAAESLRHGRLTFDGFLALQKVAFLQLGRAIGVYEKRERALTQGAIDLLNQVLDETPDRALLMIGQDDRVLSWNRGAASLYGFTFAEMFGQPLEQLFAEPDRPACRDLLEAAQRDGSSSANCSQRDRRGTTFVANVTAQRRVSEREEIVGYLFYAHPESQAHDARLADVDQTPSHTRAQGPRVLIVEDDQGVRRLTRDHLRQLGYRVDAVPDATEALRYLTTTSDVVLLLTDLKLPGMNGSELSREVRQRWPDLKLIDLSGQMSEVAQQNCGDDSAPLLGRPFELRTLAATVHDAIGPPQPEENSKPE